MPLSETSPKPAHSRGGGGSKTPPLLEGDDPPKTPSAFLGLTTARLKARETDSVAAAARQLFFAYEKKVSLCTPSARRQLNFNCSRGHKVLGAAGLKKHLPVVTTACSRDRETGSVAAAALQLFFAYEKKGFTVVCTPSARRQ